MVGLQPSSHRIKPVLPGLDHQLNLGIRFHLSLPSVEGPHSRNRVHAGGEASVDQAAAELFSHNVVRCGAQDDEEITVVWRAQSSWTLTLSRRSMIATPRSGSVW